MSYLLKHYSCYALCSFLDIFVAIDRIENGTVTSKEILIDTYVFEKIFLMFHSGLKSAGD